MATKNAWKYCSFTFGFTILANLLLFVTLKNSNNIETMQINQNRNKTWTGLQMEPKYEIFLGNHSDRLHRNTRYWTIIDETKQNQTVLHVFGNTGKDDSAIISPRYIRWKAHFNLDEIQGHATDLSRVSSSKWEKRAAWHNTGWVIKRNNHSDQSDSGDIVAFAGKGYPEGQGIYLHIRTHKKKTKKLIFGQHHPGCIERRLHQHGNCQYDGFLSIVYLNGIYKLYARANLRGGGGRYVSVAESFDLVQWSKFELITFLNYLDLEKNNIYFAAVKENPIDKGSLVGFFPVSFLHENPINATYTQNEWTGGIYIAISCDGTHFSDLYLLKSSQCKHNGHTVDHAVSGLVRKGDKIRFWIHLDVNGIAQQHFGHYSRLQAFDIPMDSFKIYMQQEKKKVGIL